MWNGTADGQTVSLSAQFVTVRPWIGVDATAALSSRIMAPGYPRIANVEALDNTGTQYTMLGRYALIIANRSNTPATIAAVRGAVPNAQMVAYQASEEVNYIYTPIFNGLTIYDDQVSGKTWWLFYAPFSTLTQDMDDQPTTTMVHVSSTSGYFGSDNDISYIRIDNYTIQITFYTSMILNILSIV